MTLVNHAMEIVTQPVDYEVEIGGTATFSVKANGAVSYQWQFNNGVNGWMNTGSEGATTDTITVVCNSARYAYKYRCIVTDKDGKTLITDSVKMKDPNIIVDEVTYGKIGESTLQVMSYNGNATSLVIPTTIEVDGRIYTVTEIGEEAFMGNTYLESIDLPDTITVIHSRAFKNCSNLSVMK